MRKVDVLTEQGAIGYLKERETAFGIGERGCHPLMRIGIAGETVGQMSAVPGQIITGLAARGMAHTAT